MGRVVWVMEVLGYDPSVLGIYDSLDAVKAASPGDWFMPNPSDDRWWINRDKDQGATRYEVQS